VQQIIGSEEIKPQVNAKYKIIIRSVKFARDMGNKKRTGRGRGEYLCPKS
jgi:hypothetical protein